MATFRPQHTVIFLSKCDFFSVWLRAQDLEPLAGLHPGSDTGPGLVPGCQHRAGCRAPEQGASSSPPRVGERGVGRMGRGVPGAFGLPLGPASPRSAGSPRVMGRWAAFARSCVLCVTLFLFASLFGKFASPPAPLQCPAVGLEGVREGRWKRGLNRFDFPIPARQRGLQAPGLWVLKSPWHRLGSWLVAGHLPPYSSPAPAQGLFGAKILKLGAESTQGCLLAPQKWGAAAGFALGPAGGSSPDGDGMRWVGMGKGMGMGKGCHP